MSYTFFIYSSPFYSAVPWEACELAKALLLKQHVIHAAFFYADAVWLADKNSEPIQDVSQAWSNLAISAKFPCYACISSVMRRDIVKDEADTHALRPGFSLSSLTEFIALKRESERVLSF